MEQLSKVALKSQFEEAFPEYAKRMESARNQEEAENIYQEIVSECYKNLRTAMSNGMLKEGEEAFVTNIKQKDYERMLKARGSDIEYRVTKVLNSIETAKKAMDSGDAETAAALMLAGGVVALGAEACAMCGMAYKAGATTYAAALKALTSCWQGVLLIASFIVTLVLIPIIYFIQKPATTVILLINDVDETILMIDKVNKHGKQLGFAKEIDPTDDGAPGRNVGGFIATKKDGALIGTTTGYHFQLEDSKKDFYIGVECPLSSLYGDNNCACSATGSAKEIADTTNSKNIQEDECSNGEYKCSIRCSGKGGSIAFYIARIYK